MKKILFIINTEGHLLSTSSLIFERFNREFGYVPFVIQVGITGSVRFQSNFNTHFLTENYFEIDPNNLDLKNTLKIVLDAIFDRVFVFLEQFSLNVFFVNHFKKKGSIICLGPDGNKPYFKNVNLSIRSRLLETYKTYTYLNKRKLFYFKPYFLSWNYGRLPQIDEYWVTFPSNIVCSNKDKVVGYTIMPNDTVLSKMRVFFNLNVSDDLNFTSDLIFYTNNILYKKELYDYELEIIKTIKDKFPDKPFYVKYHPATPDYQIQGFRDLGLICFYSAIPAELYIATLKNSIILGLWSASLMVDNPHCKFYWLHNYLVKNGKMIERIKLINPTNHILDLDDINKITF